MLIELISSLEIVLGESRRLSPKQVGFRCPFCHHEKFKLEFNLDRGIWHCWVCHARGRNINSLLRKLNKTDLLPHLPHFTDFHFKNTNNSITLIKSNLSLPKEALPIFSKSTPEFLRAQKYLIERNLVSDDLIRYNLHFCDSGEYKNRIIIPSYDKHNKLNNFVARAVYSNMEKYREAHVNKNEIIGFENQIVWNLPITLVEGVFDAIAVSFNAIPLFGTKLLAKVKEKLIEYKPIVNVCLDPEAKKEAIQICQLLIDNGITTNLVNLPVNEDPGKLGFGVWKYIDEATEVNFDLILRNKIYG